MLFASGLFGVQGNLYTDDLGGSDILKPITFRLPNTLDLTSAQAIAAAAGFLLTRFNKEDIPPKLTIVCTDKDFVCRRLRFVRENGNSTTIPFGDQLNAIDFGRAVRTILENADNVKVRCVQLLGEEHDPQKLYKRLLAGAAKAIVATTTPPTSGGHPKQHHFTPSIRYRSDAPFGDIVIENFKLMTENSDNSAPSALNAVITDPACLETTDAVGCSGKSTITTRRFLPELLGVYGTKERTFKMDIAITAHQAAQILTCGQAIAQDPAVQCVGYTGHSDSDITPYL